MEVSINGGTPKIIHFSRILHDKQHPFGSAPIYGHAHMGLKPTSSESWIRNRKEVSSLSPIPGS